MSCLPKPQGSIGLIDHAHHDRHRPDCASVARRDTDEGPETVCDLSGHSRIYCATHASIQTGGSTQARVVIVANDETAFPWTDRPAAPGLQAKQRSIPFGKAT